MKIRIPSDKETLAVLKLVKRSVLIALNLILSFLGKILPSDSKLVGFSRSRDRYDGNSRYLFEWMVRNGIECYWFYTSDKQLQKIPERLHYQCVNRNSLQGLFKMSRCGVFILSFGSGDFGKLWSFIKHRRVFNLWHAIGIKGAGALDIKFTEEMVKNYLHETSYYDGMFASSEIDRYLTASCHYLNVNSVHITGLPKSDAYKIQRRDGYSASKKFKVLYAPTFRDYKLDKSLFFPFPGFSAEVLKGFFERNSDVVIYLRPHPGDLNSIKHLETLVKVSPEKLKDFSTNVCDDIDEVLHEFDFIITDYSSIFMEPLLADRPCAFVPFDLDKYQATRGLAYNYGRITPGPKISSFEEFETSLISAMRGAPEWADERERVRDVFFTYKDTNACKRISEIVLSELS